MAYPSRKTTHHIHNGWLFWHRHLAWTSALAYPTSFPCSNTPEGQGSQGWIAGAWPQILRSGKNDAKKNNPQPRKQGKGRQQKGAAKPLAGYLVRQGKPRQVARLFGGAFILSTIRTFCGCSNSLSRKKTRERSQKEQHPKKIRQH